MGILSRAKDILESNINALLDKVEDPAKMVDQYLLNARKDLAEVTKEASAIIARAKDCQSRVDAKQKEVDSFLAKAKAAVAAGSDEDATILLSKKQKLEGELAELKETADAANKDAETMRAMHKKLVNDIADLEARKDNVKAKIAVAKGRETVNKMGAATGKASTAMSKFADMERKADERLHSAEAHAELMAEPVDEADAVAKKYSGASPTSVDDELAALKAELGK